MHPFPRSFIHSLLVLALAILSRGGSALAADSPDKIRFNRDVRPILSDNCFACHGPDKNKRKAKLRLDDRDTALSLKALVPNKPDESEIVTRIFSADPKEKMPPPESNK